MEDGDEEKLVEVFDEDVIVKDINEAVSIEIRLVAAGGQTEIGLKDIKIIDINFSVRI